MDGELRHDFTGPHEDAGICNNQGIDGDMLQKKQILIKGDKILIMGQDIDGHIDLDAPFMGIADRFGHGLGAEVSRLGPQAELPAAKIDGIGAIMNGGHQFFKGSSWGQQLRHHRNNPIAAFFFSHGKVYFRGQNVR